MLKFISIIAFGILFRAPATNACLHFSKDYTGNLQEGLQEYFIYHDGENAHMIVRTELIANKFPKEIAWVLPFPTLPTKYQEDENVLFSEIYRHFPETESALGSNFGGGAKEKGITAAVPSGLRIREPIQAGGYTIQPIEILNDFAGNEFNTWLKKNKFNPMPLRNQKYYLKKGAVFLALRMQMNFPYGASLVAKPLHITYKSDQIAIPMKFTHDNRKFDLDIYVFSKKELNSDFSAQYLKKVHHVPYKNKHLSPFLDSLIGDKKEGWLTKISGERLNQKGKEISKIKNDPVFTKIELN